MSTTAATEVDAAVWFAVAGATVKIPSINSFVYYFPEGHVESTSGNSQSSDFAIGRPFIPCQVHSVQFLCSNASDQVFAKIHLKPVTVCGNNNHNTYGVENRNDEVVSYVKILSQSDALFRTLFMPKLCADSIFPPLPDQNVTIQDTLNKAWTFRFVRRTQGRHYLTTNWAKFAVAKSLDPGDSIVFMRKKSTNELFLGIRKAVAIDARSSDGGVMEAIESACKGEVFEVDYYPSFGSLDFVVGAEKVGAALSENWSVGMTVRVAVENKDLSIVIWSQAKVMAVLWPESGSPWRMLKVNFDKPGTLPEGYRVNAWDVLSHPNPTVVNRSLLPPRLDQINNEPAEVETVSAVLNEGSSDLSPDSQTRAAVNSFKLFGKTIPIPEPVEDTDVDNNPPQL